MLLDTEPEVSIFGKVLSPQLILLHLEASLEDLLGLGSPDGAVDGDLLVPPDAERPDGVAGLREDGRLSCQRLQDLGTASLALPLQATVTALYVRQLTLYYIARTVCQFMMKFVTDISLESRVELLMLRSIRTRGIAILYHGYFIHSEGKMRTHAIPVFQGGRWPRRAIRQVFLLAMLVVLLATVSILALRNVCVGMFLDLTSGV